MASFCDQMLPFLKTIMIFLIFLWSVYILFKPLYYKPCRWSYLPLWKRVKKFRKFCLHYLLVQRCHRHHGQRPCCLNGSLFPLPCFNKHRCWDLLYVDQFPSPITPPWPRPIPSSPDLSSRLNPYKVWAVPSPPNPSAQVAAWCAPLCTRGRGVLVC